MMNMNGLRVSSAGRATLKRQFAMALGTVVGVALVTLYGNRLMGKAATFHFLERNHLELALQLDTGLSNVENGARNADATTIEKFVSQLTAARQLALQADNEVFGVEQQMLRVLGFGPLIDLPRKDIDDVNRMLAIIASSGQQAGPMPVALAARLRPGMDGMMANSRAFAPHRQ